MESSSFRLGLIQSCFVVFSPPVRVVRSSKKKYIVSSTWIPFSLTSATL